MNLPQDVWSESTWALPELPGGQRERNAPLLEDGTWAQFHAIAGMKVEQQINEDFELDCGVSGKSPCISQ